MKRLTASNPLLSVIMTDQLTDGRITEQTEFDSTTKPSDVPQSRQRILTEKGQQMYIENVNKYKKITCAFITNFKRSHL